jgi:hypothetical protein
MAAARRNVPTLDIASQAGHDAHRAAKAAPMTMIFTPCAEGITRSDDGRAGVAYTAPGVNVPLHAAWRAPTADAMIAR